MNYTLKVIKIRKETADTVTLCFKQPGLKKVKYLAGQYLTLIFRINGRRYIRPYSFSSCPGFDEFLEVTVKRVPDGIISNHINDMVKEGDSIEVMPPMGDFVYDAESHSFQSVYLWGVGSGITPLISIAKYLLSVHKEIKVYLIYGNRNNESTIFLKQLHDLQNSYQGQFTVKYFHTRLIVEDSNPLVIQGRIDKDNAFQILAQDDLLKDSAHFICGPAGLKESVRDALSLQNVNLQNVFSEDFELVKDPKDFEEIHTQQITLDFGGQEFDLEVVKGKSILEAALDANIELSYSCQTGNCSTCMGKLTGGKTKMIGLSKTREDLAEGEYLLCCTYPLGENVRIVI